MRAFECRVCRAPLFFENSLCVSCETRLGYCREELDIVPVDAGGTYVDGGGHVRHVCANLRLSGCTWLTDAAGGECFSCQLTRTRPADDDADGLVKYFTAEEAKRRLIAELDELGFPIIGRSEDPETGLAFDLLSSSEAPVVTGHHNGVITVDLAESDDLHRERLRINLDEPYRTMLGHFRHEIGHYYWALLVRGDLRETSRELFGDDRESYADSVNRHYQDGPQPGWESTHISRYATMHPWEDFAETFAHFLHICDTVQTANSYGLWPTVFPLNFAEFDSLVTTTWIPLAVALNQINRSMGKEALYPFVLAPAVRRKLQFAADLVPR